MAIRAEAVGLLYQSPFPMLANLAVAALLAMVAWGSVPAVALLGWLLCMTLVIGLRLEFWWMYHRTPAFARDPARWERRVVHGAAAVAALWASTGAAVAFGSLPVHVEGVIAISVGGMIAGAMFSLTASAAAFRAFVLPAALGPVVGFLAVGDRSHTATAAMGAVYLIVVLFWGRNAHRAIVDGIRLRLQNQALIEELQAAQEQAAAAEKLKRESFANLGHELRTPLNAIIGFAQSLEVELWGPLGSPRYRDYAQAIGDSGRHLYELIQGILDIARHDAGILELEESRFDLCDLVRSCACMMDGAARGKGVRLEAQVPEEPLPVVADATKVRQIIINLVANAVRCEADGGEVTVTAGRRDDGGVALVIQDTGVGLAAEDIPRALEPFVQVRGVTARDSGGAGLGLPLSKRLAELHDGRLEIESAPGEGTRVRVTLPKSRVVSEA